MELYRTLRIYLCISGLIATTYWVTGCKTSASIGATQPASLVKLDQKFQAFARLGDLPIPMKEREPVVTYAIVPKGHSPEYVVVVAPAIAEGEIKIPLKNTGEVVESALHYNKYLDQVLRAHRLILRGMLTEAESLLSDIDRTYEETFGTLVLKGNIAVLNRKWEEAANAFDRAARINPTAESVKKLATRITP